MDTSISIADKCYETGLVAGSPVGTCINCGNGVCEDIENPCNCYKDCVGKGKSNYLTVEEFNRYGYPIYCDETRATDLALCQLSDNGEEIKYNINLNKGWNLVSFPLI